MGIACTASGTAACVIALCALGAAAFAAANTLLRIDGEAGHGTGCNKTQAAAPAVEVIACVRWRAGLPDWQPAAP
jgi:hypothetical protein